VKLVIAWRQTDHRGVGDTITYCLGRFGKAYEQVANRIWGGCSCGDRRVWANKRYPYQ
jgi:hypothetical protein